MIGQILSFLRRHLDAQLRAESEDESAIDKVVFVEGDNMDPLQFKLGAVTMLVINVQEERTLRAADRYARVAADGRMSRSFPDIRLDLHLLFVASFKQYDESWEQLSKVIAHYQSHPSYDRHYAPDMPEGVEKLIFELTTLDFNQQNEIWNALRVNHHPSVLYRVNLLVVRDQQPAVVPLLSQSELRISGGAS